MFDLGFADVKSGCLYGGNSGKMGSSNNKLRGVQVFTYKEVEIATNRFSETNVIGNGGYGVVYKGVLSDGTLAAIKLLQREGKQGERAFRLEVSNMTSFIAFFVVFFVALSLSLLQVHINLFSFVLIRNFFLSFFVLLLTTKKKTLRMLVNSSSLIT